MKYGNCFCWCLKQWVRFGGYLKVTKSPFGPYPRMSWSLDKINWLTFVPVNPKRFKELSWILKKVPFHVLWFKGQIKKEK